MGFRSDWKAAAPLRLVALSPRSCLKGYHRQLADRVELFRHWHMLVFSPDARSLVTADRVGNPLGDIAGK